MIISFGVTRPMYRLKQNRRCAGDMTWTKWGFWSVHSLLFTVVYALLMLLPLTQWRDLLPAKDTFHRYVRVLFVTNLVRGQYTER